MMNRLGAMSCRAVILVALVSVAFPASAADSSGELADRVLKNARSDQGMGIVLGDPDGKLTTTLAKGGRMYVQSLSRDRERGDRLRATLLASGLADRSSVIWWRAAHLPYLDSLANLIVAEGWGQGDLKGMALSEIVRVLCPGGMAVVGSDTGTDTASLLAEARKLNIVDAEPLGGKGAWIKIVKPFDPALGEWAGGAAQGISVVSSDKIVAPSKEVRWVNTPLWGKSWSSYMGNSSGNYGKEIFAGGRSFHTEIEWIKPGVSQYELVARDAFNGCVLWREKISELSSVRAADGDWVYLAEGKSLVGRDATNGKVVMNYGPVGRFVLQMRDKLIVSAYCPFAVIDKKSGKTVWTRPYNNSSFPPACKDGVVFMPGSTIEAVNVDDGKTLWKATPKELSTPGGAIRAMTCKADVLYVLFDFVENSNKVTRLISMDATNGNINWTDTRPSTMAQLLPFEDQVWYSYAVKPQDKDKNDMGFTVLDAKTGKEIKTIRTSGRGGCWGVRASDQYVIWSRGTFLDRKTFEITDTFGVRSSCGVGPTPACGLLYYEPHTCNCYVALRGVFALSGGSNIPKGEEVAPALVKGTGVAASGAPAGESDWPVYRANPGRSNASTVELPVSLKELWTATLGDSSLPQATGAGGLVFVAVAEQHRVVALDVATGKEKWSFSAEGRVSMAPTYYKGLLLISDHAGWVYCLEAGNGRLVWQLQAAPKQQYMSAYGQFESSWPVKSGVLVFDDKAYFVAGRCGTMDGGVYLYGVDINTGVVQVKTNYWDNKTWVRAPKTGDLLLSDGSSLYGWGGKLAVAQTPAKATGGKGGPASPKMLKFGTTWQGPNAILDMLATMNPAGTYMKSVPSDGRAGGETIAFDADRTITTGRVPAGKKGSPDPSEGRGIVACKGASEWVNKDTGLQVRAVLLAGSRVYCAGIPEFRDPQGKPALCVLQASDGKEVQRVPLESAPSLDGLSVVGGKLLLTTVDGKVLSFASP